MATTDLAVVADQRQKFEVSFDCRNCGGEFREMVWYRTQRRAYCGAACRAEARQTQRRSLADRFWEKVNKIGTVPEDRPELGRCWLWTGSTTRGYGTIYSGRRTKAGDNLPLLAHRVSYELVVGPIPDGLTIDHLCRVTRCVRPSHLETVTMAVNILRSEGMSAQHARATHCPRGHEKTPENTYHYPSGGKTDCIPCKRSRWAAFAARRRAS